MWHEKELNNKNHIYPSSFGEDESSGSGTSSGWSICSGIGASVIWAAGGVSSSFSLKLKNRRNYISDTCVGFISLVNIAVCQLLLNINLLFITFSLNS